MPFDVEGARKSGYSDAEIAEYLGEAGEFDVEGARQSNYSDAQIVDYFAGPRKVVEAREQSIGRGFKSFGTGVTDMLSLPVAGVDLIQDLSDRVIGQEPPPRESASDRMRRAADEFALPPGDEPSGAWERGMRFMGGAATTFPLSLGAGRMVAAGGGGKNLITKALEDTYRRPIASAASEAAASIGAGIGGEAAAQIEPDSPVAQAVAELLGGVAAPIAMAPGSAVARGVIGAGRRVKDWFTDEAHISGRVGERLREVVGEDQLAGLDDLPLELAGELTRGERMRSPGQRGLEEALQANDPDYLNKAVARAERQAKAAQDYLAPLTEGGGAGEALNIARGKKRETLQARLQAVKRGIDARAEVAGLKANMAIQAAGGRSDPEEIGRITRDIIDEEYGHARKWEGEVHSRVKTDLPVEYDNFVTAHNDELARIASPDADQSIIPQWARDREASYLDGGGRTVGDLLALRKRFVSAARAEAGSEVPNRERLTYLNKMQSALLKDLENVPDSNAREAAAVSRELNDKFTRGAVGRLLGYEKTGDISTIPEATLRAALSGMPEEVGVNIDQVLAAGPQARPQVEKFIINEFLDHAFVEGEFDPRRAATFLDNPKSRAMLTRFPYLMRRFTDAKDMKDEYESALKSGELAYNTLHDSWKQALKEVQPVDYNKELTAAMSARRGGEDRIAAMRKEIAFDDMAVKGLQADVVNDVLNRSVMEVTQDGIKLWDRKKLASNVLQYRGRMKAAGVPDEQIKRLTTIMSYLERIATPVGEKSVIGGLESRGVEFGARVAGAKAGKMYSESTGGGNILAVTSAFSSEFKRRAQGWLKNMDKAQTEIAEIVLSKDDAKFRQLFHKERPKSAKIRLLAPTPYNFSTGVGQTEGRE